VKARVSFAFSLGVIALLAIAGCGGSSSSSSSTSPASASASGTPASASSGGSATVDVANNPKLGKILVDSKGMTLYTFAKDTGTTSMCTGKCAQFWPPVTSSKPTGGSGVSSSMLGTTKGSQVTYAGHPVYTFTLDKAAGQVNGNGLNEFGGVWNAVQPSGAKAPAGTSATSAAGTSSNASSSSSSSSSGGYGY
jgi:predicted lipoprotein with Yx(FWY)xxD motif